ncbi:MAG: 3-hydroxyacyl-CoA dehydrogenase family protein [Oscillospiraceae bacterium]|nr:3-hydroxyacyl-CoA dehydrogenase family protein [Oscillospiraceae bacterium]
MKLDGVTHVGIIGLGMIGDSMAVLTTGHGYKTTCICRRPEMIPEYKKTYDNYFAQLIAQGLMPENQLSICEKYLSYTTDYSAISDCEVIFECVNENLELKFDILKKIEDHCHNVKAICSVSSTITPDEMGQKMTKYKDRLIVTHPFNPAHMVPFFECCGGDHTDPKVLDFAVDFLSAMGRKPVVLKKATPGFIGNRLQFALWREALNLVESGICEPRDVDTCLNYSFCPRYTSIGIYEHFDNGGMILNQAGCNGTFPHLSNISSAPPYVTDRIARGDLGARSENKKGFYDWNGVDMKAYQERVNAPYWRFVDWDLPTE